MNRSAYIAQLRARLVSLPPDERDAAIKFYEEYFDEAGEENEQSVMDELGEPSELARKIAAGQTDIELSGEPIKVNLEKPVNEEKAQTQTFSEETSGSGSTYGTYTPSSTDIVTTAKSDSSKSAGKLAILLIIIFCIICFGLPILGGLFSVVIGLAAAFFALVLAAVVLIIGGVVVAAAGVTQIFTNTPAFVGMLGAGLVVSAIGLFLLIPLMPLTWYAIPAMFKGIKRLCKFITKKLGGLIK